MAFDPTRLYVLLLNTGLQTKDPPLYQLIHQLIAIISAINNATNTIISGGGGSTNIIQQIIQSLSGIDMVDSFDEPMIIIPSIQNLSSPFANGDILIGGPSGSITSIPDAATGNVLISEGVGVAPQWSKIIVLIKGAASNVPNITSTSDTTTGIFLGDPVGTMQFVVSGVATTSIQSGGWNSIIGNGIRCSGTGAKMVFGGADGQFIFENNANSKGVGFDVSGTDSVLALRNRALNADSSLTLATYTHSGAEIDKTYQIYTPLTGATITMSAGQSRAIINPAGLIAALTVTLPSSPVDGQVTGFSFTQAVTVLTVNAPAGATVVASPTSAAIDTNLRFLYQASSTSWFPCS